MTNLPLCEPASLRSSRDYMLQEAHNWAKKIWSNFWIPSGTSTLRFHKILSNHSLSSYSKLSISYKSACLHTLKMFLKVAFFQKVWWIFQIAKQICQITILNLNFLNYILFVFVLQLIFRLTPLAKKAGKFKRRV